MSRRGSILMIVVVALAAGGGATAIALGARALAPARTVFHFPWSMVADEAATMNHCVECHEPDKFHRCTTCHDEHGSTELAGVPFNDLILLQGDVPEPGYIPINEILPYRDQPGTHVALLDLLADHGVTDFESVTLASRDGGWITIRREDLTAEALLLPYVDGVRFAADDLHVSTWLKGVWRIVVVGPDRPLTLDGYRTSMGRLLLGPTAGVTVDQTEVMLRSKADGQVRRARTAARIEGVALSNIVADPDFETLRVRDRTGGEQVLTAAEARGAVLAQMGSDIVLVLPERGRALWITDIVELVSEE